MFNWSRIKGRYRLWRIKILYWLIFSPEVLRKRLIYFCFTEFDDSAAVKIRYNVVMFHTFSTLRDPRDSVWYTSVFLKNKCTLNRLRFRWRGISRRIVPRKKRVVLDIGYYSDTLTIAEKKNRVLSLIFFLLFFRGRFYSVSGRWPMPLINRQNALCVRYYNPLQ